MDAAKRRMALSKRRPQDTLGWAVQRGTDPMLGTFLRTSLRPRRRPGRRRQIESSTRPNGIRQLDHVSWTTSVTRTGAEWPPGIACRSCGQLSGRGAEDRTYTRPSSTRTSQLGWSEAAGPRVTFPSASREPARVPGAADAPIEYLAFVKGAAGVDAGGRRARRRRRRPAPPSPAHRQLRPGRACRGSARRRRRRRSSLPPFVERSVVDAHATDERQVAA